MGGLYCDARMGAVIKTGTAVWGLANLWGRDKGICAEQEAGGGVSDEEGCEERVRCSGDDGRYES